MSLLHPTNEDRDFDHGHTEAGLKLRVKWVKLLRTSLQKFVDGTATESDKIEARKILNETKEWL